MFLTTLTDIHTITVVSSVEVAKAISEVNFAHVKTMGVNTVGADSERA